MKTSNSLLIVLQLCLSIIGYSQITLNSASNSKIGANFIHEYSIGEMLLVHTAVNKHLTITQGYLQPNEIYNTNITSKTTNISIYPNPTLDIAYLDFFADENNNVAITLIDINGKVIYQQEKNILIGHQKIPISMQAFANGNYLLKVIIKTKFGHQQSNYKIQKQ